ncbi:MAG: AEC family transporter [Clostridia bacterium]|nr:AEC family transporter [Clostridia bacterium]
MNIFASTLNQIAFLFGFILIGYIFAKKKILPDNSATVLSKLENTLFIPALVMGTFIQNFTMEKIGVAGELLLISFIVAVIVIPLAILVSKITTKDKYIQNIYIYGLSFANFGFMGNAVVSKLYPEIFFEYLIFTLPLWILIYIWGVPSLLIAETCKVQTFKEKLKAFANPMFVGMIIGMVIGLTGIPLPGWILSLIKVSGDCMSPVAMLLTGIVVSSISLKSTFTDIKIYWISFVRLIAFPLIFIAVTQYVKIPETAYVCALCSLAMPLGLNTIVIPSAYGRDTSVAAGMAVVSHMLSSLTIPLIFTIIS